MTIIKHLNHGIQQWLPLPLPPPHPARLRLQSPPRPHFRLRLRLGLPLRSPRSLPRTPPRPRPRSPPPLPPLALSKTPPPRDGTPLSAPTPRNAERESPPVADGRLPAHTAVGIVVVGARPSAPPIARTPTFVPRRQPSPHAGHRASSSSSSRARAIVGRLLVPHARGQRRLPQRGLRQPSPATRCRRLHLAGARGRRRLPPRERADGRPPCRRSPPRARGRGRRGRVARPGLLFLLWRGQQCDARSARAVARRAGDTTRRGRRARETRRADRASSRRSGDCPRLVSSVSSRRASEDDPCLVSSRAPWPAPLTTRGGRTWRGEQGGEAKVRRPPPNLPWRGRKAQARRRVHCRWHGSNK